MKLLFSLPFLFVSLKIVKSQDEIGCFISGECTNSPFIDYTDTDDAQGCLEFCQSFLNCNQFTHYSDTKGCFAFYNCAQLSDEGCTTCISGDVTCPDLRYYDDYYTREIIVENKSSIPHRCYLPGRCEGVVLEYIADVFTPSDCLNLCKGNSDCVWWNYDDLDNTCILSSECFFVDSNCEGCIYGQQNCGEQS